MFKIGEFSRMGLVSVKTLRYYDREGLLKPAHTDESTGYRYYSAEQLPQLNKILALKGLGLSLDQIRQMLHENISTDEIRGMLKLQRAQVEQTIIEEQVKLRRIEAKLKFIDDQGKLPGADIAIKSVPEMHVLSIKEPAPGMNNFGSLIRETYEAVQQHWTGDVPLSLALFDRSQYNHEMVEWELAYVCDDETRGPIELNNDRFLRARNIPAEKQMACVVHTGKYFTLPQAYSTIAAWLQSNHFEIAGAGREVYHKLGFLDDDPDSNITEVQFPIRAKSS